MFAFFIVRPAYSDTRRWEEADSAASRALTHDPSHVKARYRRALARRKLCRYRAAAVGQSVIPCSMRHHLILSLTFQDLMYIVEQDRKNEAALKELDELRNLPDLDDDEIWPGDEEMDFRFPQDAALLLEESDLEDSTHVGNGVQCKFYNRAGCLMGSKCRFMHAPDERSVRDEL